jgi:biotin carboxyl carrier protein
MITLRVTDRSTGTTLDVEVDGRSGDPTPRGIVIGGSHRAVDGATETEVVVDGWRFEVGVEPAARAALRERASRSARGESRSGPTEVRAVIPGQVVTVAVAVGDTIEAGQALLVVEAMKMQNEVRAPRGGIVRRLAIGPSSTVDVGDPLVVIE